MEAATDRKVHKQAEERMGVLRTALKKVEASMAESEDHLKESQMREEGAHQEDQGQSDSSKEQDGDVMVEGAEGSGPTGAEATNPLRSQEAEPSMEVDMDDIPPLTSDDTTRRMTCSRVTPPQCLERWPGYRSHLWTAISLRTAKPCKR